MRIALEGRRAVILGEGGEIGRAIAAALADNGAQRASGRRRRPGRPGCWCRSAPGWRAGRRMPGKPDGSPLRRGPGRRGSARIIHVISAAGLVPLRGAAALSAQQAALASLTRALAMELAPGTLVNAVAVGCDPRMVSHTALRRAGSPEEIARATLFLADPANTYTTGHVMAVDGGWSIGYARDF